MRRIISAIRGRHAPRPLVDVVIQAARHPWTDAERKAAAWPPYPLPRPVASARERILAELDAMVPQVPEPAWVVQRIAAPRQPLAAAVAGLHRPSGFRVPDAVCTLLAAGVLSLADVERYAAEVQVPSWSGLPRQVVHHHLAAGHLAEAEAAAEAMGDNAWRGHRDIVLALAEQVDVDGVLTRWRGVRPGKERNDADRIRGTLVRAVGRRDGWRAALELTADKRIGTRFRASAFSYLAGSGAVDELRELFAGEAAGVLDGYAELSLLTHAIGIASAPAPRHDHPALAEVLARIEAIDPTVDKATMRIRDSLLFECWYGTGDEATLRRIRSALRTPAYRRELSVLRRELHRERAQVPGTPAQPD